MGNAAISFGEVFKTVSNQFSNVTSMNATELCIHDKRYKVKRSAEGNGYVSNCTLQILHPVHAGGKTGYVGLATHIHGSEK